MFSPHTHSEHHLHQTQTNQKNRPHDEPPEEGDAAALQSWLTSLAQYRQAVAIYKQQVRDVSSAAIDECQRYIAAIQEQRQQAEAQVDSHIRGLVEKGSALLLKMQNKKMNAAHGAGKEGPAGTGAAAAAAPAEAAANGHSNKRPPHYHLHLEDSPAAVDGVDDGLTKQTQLQHQHHQHQEQQHVPLTPDTAINNTPHSSSNINKRRRCLDLSQQRMFLDLS